jgi:hypothetical protein
LIADIDGYEHMRMRILACMHQVYWMQVALKRFDALIVVPVFQVSCTILSTTTGLVYFKEVRMRRRCPSIPICCVVEWL